jgi:hypothetical protein
MLEIVKPAAGSWPLIICSVVAVAIVLERLWTCNASVSPSDLSGQIWELEEQPT